jgi:hypothetical protein
VQVLCKEKQGRRKYKKDGKGEKGRGRCDPNNTDIGHDRQSMWNGATCVRPATTTTTAGTLENDGLL